MMKKGFTLIEALIVMGIIAALIGFGVVGVTRFSDYLELQNGFSDISTFIRTTQNKARNSISYENSMGFFTPPPDYYAIYFEEENFSLLACNENLSGLFNCEELEKNVKSDVFNEVKFSFGADCEANRLFGFRRSNIDIVSFDGIINEGTGYTVNNAVINSKGICTITVNHENDVGTRKIILNLTENSFEFES